MPASVPGLILTSGGDIKTAKITVQTEATGLQISDIQKYLKKKTVPQLLGNYSWKGQTLHLFGFKEGKAGTENKHELPPPLDNQLAFGDILVILSKDKKNYSKPVAFKPEEYEAFYTSMFEGFEDLDGEEDEEEDEFEEDEIDEEEAYNSPGDADEKFEDDEEEVLDEENVVDDEEEPVIHAQKHDDDDDEGGEVENRILTTKKKGSSKLSKSRAKQSKDSGLCLGGAELASEEVVPTTPPEQPHRTKVYEICKKYLSTFLTNIQCLELEHVIYNASLVIAKKKHILANWSQPLYQEVYTSLARSLIGNLQPNNYIQNDGLFTRFQKGEVTLSELGSYTFSDLYPEIWKELSIRQFEREKRQLEGNRSMATDQFQCKRCNKRECTFYELQTRSADEPMTIFINCLNCGKHWRQ